MAMLRRSAYSILNRLFTSNLTKPSPFYNPFASPTLSAPPSSQKPLWVPLTYRLYSTSIDLSDPETRRQTFNRLLYRSKQRGFLELDLVLGKWVEDNIQSMDQNTIHSLIQVLDLENPDLWKWLSGQEDPPESISANPVFTAVHEKVTSNLDSHAAPETRATPGQPWVRGWDDLRRGKDTPISGNQ